MTGKLVTQNGSGHSVRGVGRESLQNHSYLVKPHHASNFGIEDPIKTAILSPFFRGDRVAEIMKNVAIHWYYHSQVGLVYAMVVVI